jgi:enoyl-CoA hydratase/carnithine racemase
LLPPAPGAGWFRQGTEISVEIKDFKFLLFEKDAATGIVRVTLNRPEIKNALSILMMLELNIAVEQIAEDASISAMILTGGRHAEKNEPEKEAFSSGAYLDLSELEDLDEETKGRIDLTDIAQKRLCLTLWRLKKPVVAAINGMAIGGGFTIPLACADLIYVSEHAWVKLPFVN